MEHGLLRNSSPLAKVANRMALSLPTSRWVRAAQTPSLSGVGSVCPCPIKLPTLIATWVPRVWAPERRWAASCSRLISS